MRGRRVPSGIQPRAHGCCWGPCGPQQAWSAGHSGAPRDRGRSALAWALPTIVRGYARPDAPGAAIRNFEVDRRCRWARRRPIQAVFDPGIPWLWAGGTDSTGPGHRRASARWRPCAQTMTRKSLGCSGPDWRGGRRARQDVRPTPGLKRQAGRGAWRSARPWPDQRPAAGFCMRRRWKPGSWLWT